LSRVSTGTERKESSRHERDETAARVRRQPSVRTEHGTQRRCGRSTVSSTLQEQATLPGARAILVVALRITLATKRSRKCRHDGDRHLGLFFFSPERVRQHPHGEVSRSSKYTPTRSCCIAPRAAEHRGSRSERETLIDTDRARPLPRPLRGRLRPARRFVEDRRERESEHVSRSMRRPDDRRTRRRDPLGAPAREQQSRRLVVYVRRHPGLQRRPRRPTASRFDPVPAAHVRPRHENIGDVQGKTTRSTRAPRRLSPRYRTYLRPLVRAPWGMLRAGYTDRGRPTFTATLVKGGVFLTPDRRYPRGKLAALRGPPDTRSSPSRRRPRHRRHADTRHHPRNRHQRTPLIVGGRAEMDATLALAADARDAASGGSAFAPAATREWAGT